MYFFITGNKLSHPCNLDFKQRRNQSIALKLCQIKTDSIIRFICIICVKWVEFLTFAKMFISQCPIGILRAQIVIQIYFFRNDGQINNRPFETCSLKFAFSCLISKIHLTEWIATDFCKELRIPLHKKAVKITVYDNRDTFNNN